MFQFFIAFPLRCPGRCETWSAVVRRRRQCETCGSPRPRSPRDRKPIA